MKKHESISLLAGKMECSKAAVERLEDNMNAVVEILAKSVEVGDRVKIGKYIVIEKQEVAARSYRNPKTGEAIEKEAGIRVVVKPTKAFKGLA